MGRNRQNALIVASICAGAVPVLLLLPLLLNPFPTAQGQRGKTHSLQFLDGEVEISLSASHALIKDKISVQRCGHVP